MTIPREILVVEDDTNLNRMLCDQLERLGHKTRGIGSIAALRETVTNGAPDLAFVDMNLPDGDGFAVMEALGGACPVIFLTAFGSVDHAVRAVRAGAADYLLKPVSRDKLEIALSKALTTMDMERHVRFLEDRTRKLQKQTVVGDSPGTAEMRRLIAVYAAADSPVLIRGEGGTGKEMIARTIHETGLRAEGRFVPVECETPDEARLDSELFGHERGAFAGAEERREGLIELAQGGTVYLNDIADLAPRLQAKLLRVMESGQFRRLGGAQTMTADVRIIAGTRRDLERLSIEGAFRSELFYRLNAFTLHVPPLRDRPGDIAALARHFISERSFLRDVDKRLAVDALHALMDYDWPGNVRELRNVVERALIMSGTDLDIRPDHLALPGTVSGGARGGIVLSYPDPPTMEQLRDDYIAQLLQRFDENRSLVAKAMGISERNLYRLLRKS
ncbi:MAG: Fis family transcriptional regulator [Proteobacteria bacterium]|nr:MAG: Fis family transcriptional regulator [Pseudomonadota bacterium]